MFIMFFFLAWLICHTLSFPISNYHIYRYRNGIGAGSTRLEGFRNPLGRVQSGETQMLAVFDSVTRQLLDSLEASPKSRFPYSIICRINSFGVYLIAS